MPQAHVFGIVESPDSSLAWTPSEESAPPPYSEQKASFADDNPDEQSVEREERSSVYSAQSVGHRVCLSCISVSLILF